MTASAAGVAEFGGSLPRVAEPVAAMAAFGQPVRARTVAVCDDDVRFIRYVERLLSEADARIVPVTTLDPGEAVRVVADAGCNAVMIDLNIYNDSLAGLTLVRLFREHPATQALPLLMVTGAPQRDLKQHDLFLRSHGCALLPKPFEAEALLSALGLALPVAASA